MAVTSFQDLPLADTEREWDGDAAEARVRRWAKATDEPNEKYRDAHVWYDAEKKGNYTAYKLLIADAIDGKLFAVPRGVMAAGAVMLGSRGGVDLPDRDRGRVKIHLASGVSSKFLCVWRDPGACIARRRSAGVPGRMTSFGNAARCVPGPRQASMDFGYATLGTTRSGAPSRPGIAAELDTSSATRRWRARA